MTPTRSDGVRPIPTRHDGPRVTPIPFLTPRLPDPELVARDYAEIYAAGVFTNSGPFEQRFAAELAEWIGNGVGVSVTANATSGIQLAARVLFRRDRRHVLVASFTAPAGPLALRWSGYEPLLIDIDRASWQPDPDAAEKALVHDGDDIAGILLTTTFGAADESIGRWETMASDHGIALVIDSAPGFASTYQSGELLGARGDCEIFSFHATKTVGIGEGGAVAARNPEVVEQIDQLKNFGFDKTWRSVTPGLNAKLPEIASAMGLRQLEVLTKRLAQRRMVLGWYVEMLESLGCELQPGLMSSTPAFLSALLPSGTSRPELGRALDTAGIGWRAYFDPPVHRQPSFARVDVAGDLKVTDEIASRMISLPLDDEMSVTDVERVAGIVGTVVNG
jgi:dTDP-4-amino-4,6-dideoxygalactose transaminase